MSTFNFIIIKPRPYARTNFLQPLARSHTSMPGMYFVCKYTCAHGKINFEITELYYAFGEKKRKL